MSLLSWLFRSSRKTVSGTARPTAARPSLPTVQFEPRLIDKDAKADLRRQVNALSEIEPHHREAVYKAALKGVIRGGDLGAVASGIMRLKIEGMGQRRAGEIARSLLRQTVEPVRRKRTMSLGIVHAQWLYAGVPCSADGKSDPHRSLNGKRYEISKGVLVDGKRIWPGQENECRCSYKSIVPGLDKST